MIQNECRTFSYQSLGAGVQSSVITEMIVEKQLPPVDIVIFADTGDEPGYVYDQVDYLRGRLEPLGIPLVTVSNGNLVRDIYGGRRFVAIPLFTKQFTSVNGFGISASRYTVGRLKRQCTREYKIVPIEKCVRQALLDRGLAQRYKDGRIRVNKFVRVQCHLGISWDEMQRMKPNNLKWINNHFPLIDLRMTRADCVSWLMGRGFPVPKKSSCKRCPYHDLSYFRRMKQDTPDDFNEVVSFDHDLRNRNLRLRATAKGELYLIRDCVPLDEVDLQDGPQLEMDLCNEGYCFV